MTNSHPLARLLDGVTRYDLSDHGDAMLQKPLGDWVWYDDVLAALDVLNMTEAATLRAEVERLRGALGNLETELTGVTPEPDNMRMAIDTARSAARAALEGKANE